MTIMLKDIQLKREREAEELREQYGDIRAKSYVSDDYTAEEWQIKKDFEMRGTDAETYSGCIGMGDLSGFSVEQDSQTFSKS